MFIYVVICVLQHGVFGPDVFAKYLNSNKRRCQKMTYVQRQHKDIKNRLITPLAQGYTPVNDLFFFPHWESRICLRFCMLTDALLFLYCKSEIFWYYVENERENSGCIFRTRVQKCHFLLYSLCR